MKQFERNGYVYTWFPEGIFEVYKIDNPDIKVKGKGITSVTHKLNELLDRVSKENE